MKKNLVLVCLLIAVIGFVAVGTYFWFNYFLDLGSDGALTNNVKSTLVLTDQNKIYASYDEGVDVADDVLGYKFKVENKGVNTVNYRLVLLEISPSQVKDGCSTSTLLKASELNYELYLNDSLIKNGNLGELENRVLDTRRINIDITNNYELKVWLNSTSLDSEGKHYHYKVDLEVIE